MRFELNVITEHESITNQSKTKRSCKPASEALSLKKSEILSTMEFKTVSFGIALVIVVSAIVAGTSALPVPGDSSHRKHPTSESPLARVELDQYLKNKRAMALQIKCVVYDGPCDIVGKEVKKYIVVGLSGHCSDCSPRLKSAVEKVAQHIQENYPQAWYDAIYKYLVAPSLGDSYRTSTTSSQSSTTEEATTLEPEQMVQV